MPAIKATQTVMRFAATVETPSLCNNHARERIPTANHHSPLEGFLHTKFVQ